MAEEQNHPKGLECLSDEALAKIVEQGLEEHDELKYEAAAAFAELERRTPESR